MSPEPAGDPKVAESASDEKKQQPDGFGDVAKRIRSRTTDLLAIAVVLMGGLAIGSRIRGWWNTDETDLTSPNPVAESQQGADSPWGAGDAAVSIDFGDSPHTITRAMFTGNRKSAAGKLAELCRSVVKTATRPAVLREQAEDRMLKRLVRFKPVDQKPGLWRVYQFDGPVLMATATRRFSSEQLDAAESAKQPAGVDAKPPYRVVCWGMAFPSGKDRWTLFTFQPAASGRENPARPRIVVAAPPETLRVFSLRDDNSRTWLTFRGRGPLSDWMRFYDEQALERDWRIESNWQTAPNRAAAVYLAGAKENRRRIALTFQGDPSDGFTGTAIVTPLASRKR